MFAYPTIDKTEAIPSPTKYTVELIGFFFEKPRHSEVSLLSTPPSPWNVRLFHTHHLPDTTFRLLKTKL